MHYLYILKSEETGKYYIGESCDVEKRLEKHTSGKTSYGKRNNKVKLVFKKTLGNRSEAKKLESFLKRQKSRKFIDKFIDGKINIPR
jgi:putative endonuclease